MLVHESFSISVGLLWCKNEKKKKNNVESRADESAFECSRFWRIFVISNQSLVFLWLRCRVICDRKAREFIYSGESDTASSFLLIQHCH